MNNRKIQANMQINVGFVADTTELVKKIENEFKGLNLGSSLFSGVTTGLEKNFKDIYSNLDKMTSSLSKRGLSTKQYENLFSTFNDNVLRSIDNIERLKDKITEMYKSDENKTYLKNLQEQRDVLADMEKIATRVKSARTRANTNAQKAKDELGLDFSNSVTAELLTNITERRANKKGLTPAQQKTIFGGFSPEELERAITLWKQYNEQIQLAANGTKEIQQASGARGRSAEEMISFLQGQIDKLDQAAMSQEEYNKTIQQYEALIQQLKLNTQMEETFQGNLTSGWSDASQKANAEKTLSEIAAQFGIVGSLAVNTIRIFKRLVKYSFDFYKSLDSALNQIYVVSNLSSEAVNNLTGNFINMARETGMSIDDVTRAAVLFYQQGLNTDEVMKMTEVTAQFAKVAGTDATDAADKLTAAVNGYRLSAEDAMSVADKFNKVAAASAADIDELSTAFSKAAAQANQAGVSMDNYLAYIATMEEATREAPENLGTSLKTIFSRMQQVKTGENDDGVDINQVETALRSVGIALRDTSGQLRDLEDIFDELGPKWNSLDRNTQAYLGTIIAGTRQQSRFITLMQNWDRVLELSEESANSAGQQALMHAKAMDSIESKIQQMTVAWQEFVSNLSNSNMFKGIIKGLTNLINLLNGANQPLTLMVGGLALLSSRLASNGTFSAIGDKMKSGLGSIFSFFSGKTDQQDIKSFETQIDGIKKGATSLGETLDRFGIHTDNARNKFMLLMDNMKQNSATWAQVASKAQAAGAAMMAAGVAISNFDQNIGGAISSAGSLALGLGKIVSGTDPIGGAVVTITGIFQLMKTIRDWSENWEKKMTEAIDKVKNSLQEVSNASTKINSLDRLVDKYDKLASQIYLTTEEQEKLNDTIQQMGDLSGVDVITDEFGNLHINRQEVDDALEELKIERENLAKELAKQEVDSAYEATFMTSNKATDYYSRLFKGSRSEYKNLLGGVSDGLTDQTRKIGSTAAKSFNNSFKTALIKEVEHDKFSYLEEGFGNAMTRLESSINDSLSDNDWNSLYKELDYLQKNVDNMTFNDVQDSVNQFYDNWSGRTKIAEEEWNVLKNAIMGTVFENDSMLQFFDKVDDMMDRAGLTKDGSTYYAKQYEKVLDQMDKIRAKKAGKNALGIGIGGAGGALAGTAIGGFAAGAAAGAGLTSWSGPGALVGAGVGALVGGVGSLLFPSEETKKYRNLRKVKNELQKQEKEYLKSIKEEHALLTSTDEAKQWILAHNEIRDAVAGANSETQRFLGTISNFTNMEDLTADEAEEYSKIIKKITPQLNAAPNDAQRTNVLIKLLTENMSGADDEVREKLQDVIDSAFNNLALPAGYTFTQIGDELDHITEDLRTMNSLVKDFTDNGYLTLDQFKSLAKIIDSIDIGGLYQISDLDNGVNYVNDYIDALHNLDLAFDQNNGAFTANAEAIKSLQTIEQVAAKSKIQNMINEIEAKRTQVQAEIGYIDIQIKTNQAMIKTLQTNTAATIKTEELKKEAEKQAQADFGAYIDSLNTGYRTNLSNANKWTVGIVENLDIATEAWGRYWKAVAGQGDSNLGDLKTQAQKAIDNVKWEAYDAYNFDKYGKYIDKDERKQIIKELESYNVELENLKTMYQGQFELYTQEINVLEKLKGADLSNLGLDGDTSKIDKYIGKLKEIYNILNRIQVLEHRLGVLDTYQDIAIEGAYGKILKERLSLNEELLDQYDFLVSEQKKFTNGYKDFINSVEGLEGVFDFDQYGQIIINWEKYVALQDEAIDGQVTLKEKADDVYETYTEMFQELQDDFDKYIKYLKQIIDLENQIIDAYVSTENRAADNIKEIYQDILNTKLDAIDQEKEAIEELREARERANKETQYSKEVAGIQSDIQRAMMDTSGASATSLIRAQANLDDKLNEIAEDRYSEMLDGIIDRLDEQKEALQQEFDDMFDDLTWLFEWLESGLMTDPEGLADLYKQTAAWRQETPIERQKDLSNFLTEFSTYWEILNDGTTIYDVYDQMVKNTERIGDLDKSLVQSVGNASAEITQTLAKWNQDMNSKMDSISSSLGGLGARITALENNKAQEQQKSKEEILAGGNITTDAKGNQKTTVMINPNNQGKSSMETRNVTVGSTFTLPAAPASPQGYHFLGWRILTNNGKGELKQPGEKVTVNSGISIIAEWEHFSAMTVPTGTSSSNSNTKPFTIQTKPWMPYATGGLADYTGLAVLHGSTTKPEAVLNALQTEHFLKFTNALDNMYNQNGGTLGLGGNTIAIDTISFNVDSMSSPEDGERAFDAFVNKFNEIGSQSGIKFNNFNRTI